MLTILKVISVKNNYNNLMKNTSPIKTELRVKSPLISVIIPVFNVEEYLEECISSIRCV